VTLACCAAAGALAACGGASGNSGSASGNSGSASGNSGSGSTTTQAGTPRPAHQRASLNAAVRLTVTGRAALPAARTGGAAAAFNSDVVFSGGLSSAGTSTATVFTLTRGGRSATAGPLPGPVHDAAEAQLGSRLLLFGGGQSEGSDRIVRVLPAPSSVIGRIPQALSDLDAVVVDNVAFVIGGWNGTETNRAIYAVKPTGSGAGAGLQVHAVAQLPLGVRYPAAAPLAGRVIVAGGETTSGTPTAAAWSLDPATFTVTPLASLPAPTDHAPGAVINGRFYLLGGLRRGSFTDAILSWAPGERRWRTAGRLPSAISDATAVSLPGTIAVLGGRGASGALATVTWLAARAG
jgi:hypothetical protein